MIMMRDNKCGICGRRGKLECLAIDEYICTSCCGSKRGSALACPPDCSNFPFGTEAYNTWLRVDGTWFPKALKYVLTHVEREEFADMLDRLTASHRYASEIDEESAIYNAVHYCLGTLTNDDGKTLGELWEQDDWVGLNNDERIMATHRIHTWPTIIEVQKILNDQALICVDILDPDHAEFMVFDRATAANALRFSRYLLWVTHYPYFSRIEGGGIEVSSHVHDQFLTKIEKLAKRKKKEQSWHSVKLYLSANFAASCDLLRDMSIEARDKMFQSMDIDHFQARYEFKVPKVTIKAIIDKKQDFKLDDTCLLNPEDPQGTEYYYWLRRGDAKAVEKEMPVYFQHDDSSVDVVLLGSIRLYADSLMIETLGEKKFDFIKKLMNSYFGSKLRLVEEKRIEFTEQMLNQDNLEDLPSTPPPKISQEDTQEAMQKYFFDYYTRLLDDPVPILNNMTPRQAAVDPEMRSSLLDMMKMHINGFEERQMKEGIVTDIDWFLKELNLKELL